MLLRQGAKAVAKCAAAEGRASLVPGKRPFRVHKGNQVYPGHRGSGGPGRVGRHRSTGFIKAQHCLCTNSRGVRDRGAMEREQG